MPGRGMLPGRGPDVLYVTSLTVTDVWDVGILFRSGPLGFPADRAYPAPVTCDTSRAAAHQAWQHGQVLLGEYGDRLVLAVPGTVFGADLVLDAVSRLAKAVGAAPERYAAHLRIGERGPRRAGSEG